MENILGYIFKSMDKSEKAFKYQSTINRRMGYFALAVVLYEVVEAINDWRRDANIEKLRNEIEELKRMKGR